MIELLRVILGYLLSSYKNAKKAVLFIGETNTGKSVLARLIENLVGSSAVEHVDFADLDKPAYVAKLASVVLNIGPDISDRALSDSAAFKSLTSDLDTIKARALYSNPQEVKGGKKLVYFANHKLMLKGNMSKTNVDAFFFRWLYFPFQNKPTPEEKQDKELLSKLLAEKDGIFTWAMQGAQYYSEHTCFPQCMVSKTALDDNRAIYDSLTAFIERYVKKTDKRDEFVRKVEFKGAYAAFCEENDVELVHCLDKQLTKLFAQERIRNQRVFKGICLSRKCREQFEEEIAEAVANAEKKSK